MPPRKLGYLGHPRQGRPYVRVAVGDNIDADAAATKQNTALRVAAGDLARERVGIIGIIVARIARRGAEVLGDETQFCQLGHQSLLEIEASVIGGDRNLLARFRYGHACACEFNRRSASRSAASHEGILSAFAISKTPRTVS